VVQRMRTRTGNCHWRLQEKCSLTCADYRETCNFL